MWLGPPANALGAGCPLGFVLARTDQVALGVNAVVAFPIGFCFTLSVRRRTPSPNGSDWGDLLHRRAAPGGLDPGLLRVGLQFSDGRKATSLDAFPDLDPEQPEQLPPGPVLMHHGGSGGGLLSFDHGYWVWPLPPAGPLAFVCEWPAEGIPLTRVEVDAVEITAAAARAPVLWEAAPPSGGWTHY